MVIIDTVLLKHNLSQTNHLHIMTTCTNCEVLTYLGTQETELLEFHLHSFTELFLRNFAVKA